MLYFECGIFWPFHSCLVFTLITVTISCNNIVVALYGGWCRWLPAKVMYPANSTKHISRLTRSTPIFIVEDRFKYIVDGFEVKLSFLCLNLWVQSLAIPTFCVPKQNTMICICWLCGTMSTRWGHIHEGCLFWRYDLFR